MPDAMMQAVASSDETNVPTILVVDDEDLVRLPIAEYLRDCGYHVLEAGDAREAIDRLDDNHIDLVFSDVRMPGGMDGFGLARWLRAHRPEIPVLLTSGYNSSWWTAGPDRARLISKPYSQARVLERIRAALRR